MIDWNANLWNITRWFYIWWYRYLFEKRNRKYASWPTTIWCRIRNHPEGVWWYNPNGFEPDMRCKNCGDDLG